MFYNIGLWFFFFRSFSRTLFRVICALAFKSFGFFKWIFLFRIIFLDCLIFLFALKRAKCHRCTYCIDFYFESFLIFEFSACHWKCSNSNFWLFRPYETSSFGYDWFATLQYPYETCFSLNPLLETFYEKILLDNAWYCFKFFPSSELILYFC